MEFLKLCGTRPAHAYSICFNQSEEASGECSLYVINIFWAFLFRLFFCIYNHLSFSATRSSGLFQARNTKNKNSLSVQWVLLTQQTSIAIVQPCARN